MKKLRYVIILLIAFIFIFLVFLSINSTDEENLSSDVESNINEEESRITESENLIVDTKEIQEYIELSILNPIFEGNKLINIDHKSNILSLKLVFDEKYSEDIAKQDLISITEWIFQNQYQDLNKLVFETNIITFEVNQNSYEKFKSKYTYNGSNEDEAIELLSLN